jgi:hypothetical protein
VVVRGPAICGAVGGDRSALSAAEAIPAVKRRSPAPPQTLAATFKAREAITVFGRNPLEGISNCQTLRKERKTSSASATNDLKPLQFSRDSGRASCVASLILSKKRVEKPAEISSLLGRAGGEIPSPRVPRGSHRPTRRPQPELVEAVASRPRAARVRPGRALPAAGGLRSRAGTCSEGRTGRGRGCPPRGDSRGSSGWQSGDRR